MCGPISYVQNNGDLLACTAQEHSLGWHAQHKSPPWAAPRHNVACYVVLAEAEMLQSTSRMPVACSSSSRGELLHCCKQEQLHHCQQVQLAARLLAFVCCDGLLAWRPALCSRFCLTEKIARQHTLPDTL